MAISPSLLASPTPKSVVPTEIQISHVQLRDLIICPRVRGKVNYIRREAIYEHDLNDPSKEPHKIASLTFTPDCLTALVLPETDTTLMAAGGQEAELHLSLHRNFPSSTSTVWQHEHALRSSINNSVLLTRSNQSSAEPRVAISNNDASVRFFDVPVRSSQNVKNHFREIGCVRFQAAVNHSSLSPDGTTLLSVGDSSKVHLHRISGSGQLSFTPIATLSLPPPDWSVTPPAANTSIHMGSLAASFSTSFSADGTKYAVASQEGVVAVWDVRSTKPLKVFHTDKTRMPEWLSDDPWDWTRGSSRGPGWSARCVKFGGGSNGHGYGGKETMVFTEHTSLLHVVDARTFETEEIVSVPRILDAPLRPRSIGDHGSERRYQPWLRNPPAPLPPPAPTRLRNPTRPSFVMALHDTFRISASGSTTSSSRLDEGMPREDDLVVIPPMGDRQIENDVQALLGGHGIRTTRTTEASRMDVDGEDEDEEEEEEDEECVTTRPGSPSRWTNGIIEDPEEDVIPPGSEEDLDIAGVCFDPSGGRIYVATTQSVVEWEISGADKRWWVGEKDRSWA